MITSKRTLRTSIFISVTDIFTQNGYNISSCFILQVHTFS